MFKLLLLGAEFHDLREYADSENAESGKKPWGICDGQLRRYMTQAHDLIEERSKIGRDRAFSRHLLQRRAIYARAIESGDWRSALSVAQDEAKLLNLYPAERAKVELSGQVKHTHTLEALTDEQLDAIARADQPASGSA